MCNINIKTLKDIDKYFQLGYKYYSGENIPIDKKQAFLYFNYCSVRKYQCNEYLWHYVI